MISSVLLRIWNSWTSILYVYYKLCLHRDANTTSKSYNEQQNLKYPAQAKQGIGLV